MFTFRYNPLFKEWVMLGETALAKPLKPVHFLDVGKSPSFQAATYPQSVFLLGDEGKRGDSKGDLLFQEAPAVGEYELLLYKGEQWPLLWSEKLWEEWLTILQTRLKQLLLNPYLHFVKFTFNTQATNTVGETYLRVGDLIGLSHPVCGEVPLISQELALKLEHKDTIFCIKKNQTIRLYVPSAPLYPKEMWLIPENRQSSFLVCESKERAQFAKVLAVLMRNLNLNYPESHFVIRLYTDLLNKPEEETWWFQIHEAKDGQDSLLSIQALPEKFVHTLHTLLN
jgi:hypothetical protein